MKQLSIREVRGELPRLDELLSAEGEVVITRRGKPIARVLAVKAAQRMPSHADLRAGMPRLVRGSEAHVRKARDER